MNKFLSNLNVSRVLLGVALYQLSTYQQTTTSMTIFIIASIVCVITGLLGHKR